MELNIIYSNWALLSSIRSRRAIIGRGKSVNKAENLKVDFWNVLYNRFVFNVHGRGGVTKFHLTNNNAIKLANTSFDGENRSRNRNFSLYNMIANLYVVKYFICKMLYQVLIDKQHFTLRNDIYYAFHLPVNELYIEALGDRTPNMFYSIRIRAYSEDNPYPIMLISPIFSRKWYIGLNYEINFEANSAPLKFMGLQTYAEAWPRRGHPSLHYVQEIEDLRWHIHRQLKIPYRYEWEVERVFVIGFYHIFFVKIKFDFTNAYKEGESISKMGDAVKRFLEFIGISTDYVVVNFYNPYNYQEPKQVLCAFFLVGICSANNIRQYFMHKQK